MHNLYVEKRSLGNKTQTSLSRDLADHILQRAHYGKMIIATSRPINLLATTRKQWLKRLARLEVDRAKTLDTTRRSELSQRISLMHRLTFSASPPHDLLEVDVTFATPENLIKIAPICNTAYIVGDINIEQQHLVTSWMPNRGMVIIYEKNKATS